VSAHQGMTQEMTRLFDAQRRGVVIDQIHAPIAPP
jgi:hypothetical protein